MCCSSCWRNIWSICSIFLSFLLKNDYVYGYYNVRCHNCTPFIVANLLCKKRKCLSITSYQISKNCFSTSFCQIILFASNLKSTYCYEGENIFGIFVPFYWNLFTKCVCSQLVTSPCYNSLWFIFWTKIALIKKISRYNGHLFIQQQQQQVGEGNTNRYHGWASLGTFLIEWINFC